MEDSDGMRKGAHGGYVDAKFLGSIRKESLRHGERQ
jgi:hypothetical protein